MREAKPKGDYFSSLTGRPFPPHFRRGDETVEVAGRPAISVNEGTAHLTALPSGLGVSQTFRFMVRPYVERGELVPLLSDWTRPRHPLNILYPPTRQLNARLRVFVDWSAEVFKEFDWPTD